MTGADALSTGLSGLRAAGERLRVSAADVAAWPAPGARDRRALLTARRGGGVDAAVGPGAGRPDLAREAVEQRLAVHHARASARVVESELERRGTLVDLLA